MSSVASWEDVPPLEGCTDGRHPAHTRLDPVASAEAIEQLVALGYIEKPGPNIEEYVESTVRELRYNLIESYQDANRHREALDLARDLCRRDPEEQRYALKRFLSCQALGLSGEMREIVDDMAGRRRKAAEEAHERMAGFRELAQRRYDEKRAAAGEAVDEEKRRLDVMYEMDPRSEPPEPREYLLNPDERKELLQAVRMRRYNAATTDLLEAQTLVAERRWFEALEVLRRLGGARTIRPGILLQTADLLRRLRRLPESEASYRRALQADPDNVLAHLGLCRLALLRRDFAEAEKAATECVGRLHFNPMAHYLRAIARIGLAEYGQARESLQTALSQNPHFPQAHLRLARLLRFRFNDPEGAREHIGWYREMRSHRPVRRTDSAATAAPAPPAAAEAAPFPEANMPPLGEDVLVVSGLPRSGTSMLMQMLDAGGVSILTDGIRLADEDNPKGYFEFEAVKRMFREQSWIGEARGKALKVVAPLVCSLPPGCRYRVVLIERDYDEILDSQAKMIERRGESVEESSDRRERLRREYARVMEQTRAALTGRVDVRVLQLRYDAILRDPERTAEAISRFAGGSLDTGRMAAAVDRSLHRNVAGKPRA